VTVGRLLLSLFHRVTGKKYTTSQQRQRPTQYAHTGDLSMAAASQAYGLARAAPGISLLVSHNEDYCAHCGWLGLGYIFRV